MGSLAGETQIPVYASPEARGQLGPVVDRVGNWNGKPVFIVTADDIGGLNKGGNPDDVIPKLREHLDRLGYTAALPQKDMEEIARAAINDRPKNFDEDSVSIIVAPSASFSKEKFFSNETGIPARDLEGRLPGSDRDWKTFILAHEAGHGDQLYYPIGDPRNFQNEIDADKAGKKNYETALKDGLVSDAGLPDAALDMRALTSFIEPSREHNTSVAIPFAGNPNPAIAVPSTLRLGLQDAVIRLAEEVAKDMGTRSHIEDTLKIMHYATDEPRFQKFTDQDRLLLEDIATGVKPRDSAFDKAGGLSPEARKILEEGVKTSLLMEAASMLEDPRLMYATAKKLYDQDEKANGKGPFAGNPIGKEYVREYLNAAREYGPEHYGVEPNPKLKPGQPEYPDSAIQKIEVPVQVFRYSAPSN